MRRTLGSLAVAALVSGSAASAGAATLFFTGTLNHQAWGVFGPVSFSGAGVATSSGGGFSLPGDAFVGSEVATTPSFAAPPITGNTHVIQSHAPGSFTGTPLGGSMALGGQIKVLAYGGLTLFSIPFSAPGGAVGVGGSFTVAAPGLGGLTVQAAPWSTGSLSYPTFQTPGGVTPAVQGFDDRNAKGVGTTRLVTSYVLTSGGGPLGVGLLSLDLTFVPEPPGAAGMALGAAALAAAGVGRSRTRSAAQEARRP